MSKVFQSPDLNEPGINILETFSFNAVTKVSATELESAELGFPRKFKRMWSHIPNYYLGPIHILSQAPNLPDYGDGI